MEVIRTDAAEGRTLGEEYRRTYQGSQLRVVFTHIPPGHSQRPHLHRMLYDATYVIEGAVTARDGVEVVTVSAGDLVVFAPGTIHNIENQAGAPAMLLTVKFLRTHRVSDSAFRAICETDWIDGATQVPPPEKPSNS